MKKLSGIFVILFLIYSCNKISKSNNTTQKVIIDNVSSKNTFEKLVFFYDDSQDTVVTNTYLLKNDFRLISYPAKEEENNEIKFRLIGKNIDTIVMNEPISNKKNTNYFDNTDFENYFAIKKSGGSTVHFWLIDKKTGKECFDGMQVQFDFTNEVIIYANEDDNYELYLYDLNDKRNISIKIPYEQLAEYDCIKYNDLWKTVYLKKSTNSSYSLGFRVCDSIVSFNIIR